MNKKYNKYLKKLSHDFHKKYIDSINNRPLENFKFGSIYSTTRNDFEKCNIVAIIDTLDDIDVTHNNFVTVCPISDDILMATESDLIFLGKNRGPFMFDFFVHCELQATVRRKDLINFLGSLNDDQCSYLYNFLKKKNSYQIDTKKKFKIGAKIIQKNDYRIKYQEKIAMEMEYLVMPSMYELSNLLNEFEQEDEIKNIIKPENNRAQFKYLLSFLYANYSIDLNYKQFIDTYNKFYFDKSRKELDTINEILKSGFNIIIQKDHPTGPDFIIENEKGDIKEINIKNDIIIELYKYRYEKCLRSISYRIERGRMEEIPQFIYKWENEYIPLTKLNNIYGSTLKWIPDYAVGNVKGLKKTLKNLLWLKENEINHLDVDYSIITINARINQLLGNFEKAIELYDKLNIKYFMVKYRLFTDPRIDCFLKLGNKNAAIAVANRNPRLGLKRAEWASKAPGNPLWKVEALSAGELISA